MSRLRPTLLFATLFALAYFLAACRGEVVPLAVDEQAQIDCTDECATRGQCGRLLDDRLVVLANEGRPAVSAHNRFFLDEALVVVREVVNRELVAASNGSPQAGAVPFAHVFYRVEGEGKNAWVSEWCVARP